MKKLFLSAMATTLFMSAYAQRSINLSSWEFSQDKQQWENVTVPHDWAIKGPFDKKWDLQKVAIVQNGETEATEKSGRSGSLPWIGKGFYCTTVSLTADEVKEFAELQFDGAMSDAKVWVNGQYVGNWPYGYNAFRFDITRYLKAGDNSIEVSLENVEESSRWYPGGGIYRPVTLRLASKSHIDDWATHIVPEIDECDVASGKGSGYFIFDTKVAGAKAKGLMANVEVVDKNGHSILNSGNLKFSKNDMIAISLMIEDVNLWSPETPYLYNTRVKLMDKKGNVIDTKEFKTGMKKVEIDRDGFRLNGVKRKFQGVCLHHDLGPLGAAVNKSALIRQVKIMKDMGCDAIRTSHNMPSTMQMEVCDSLGMMVMAESFDMWRYAKCKNGYARFFDEWADKDITNLVLNHRNHASLVMWSIGNEIPEQWTDDGWGTREAKHLQDLCHQLDSNPVQNTPVHLVTQGCDNADGALASGFMQTMDIPGYNYRVHKYDDGIGKLPCGFLLGSETASTVSSRGVYKFPLQLAPGVTHPDGQCTGYDVEYCAWSNLPDDDFMLQEDREWTIGQFVWTGFDYLGEPTPYDEYWPSRSSYFGICDLAGLPKDRYYLYRSQWNKKDHTIHLLPHWTWPDRVGEVTPVYCYTDYPEAELFVNGKSQGRIHKQLNQKDIATSGLTNWNEKLTEQQGLENALKTNLLDRYRLRWNNVVYQPGEVKVVVYDEYGNKAGEEVIKTAGEPKSLKLETDRIMINRDGGNLAYITVSVVDEDGTLIPYADDDIEVTVYGQGKFAGICNGDATSLEVFTEPHMKLFAGQLVVTVQAIDLDKPGVIKVAVVDKKLNDISVIDIPISGN